MHQSYEWNGSSITGSRSNCGELIILIVVIGQKKALLLLSLFISFEYFNFAMLSSWSVYVGVVLFSFDFEFRLYIQA